MQAVRLLREDHEIDARLEEFGVTRQELIEVVRAVVAARADAVSDDPASAEGLFAYIFGTRALRQAFKAHGWMTHRENNVEAVRHPERDLKVIYQSVDMAADWLHTPRAISGKGAGADRLIAASHGCLFSEAEMGIVQDAAIEKLKAGAWFFCVSVDGDDVRAELSLPSSVSKGNFDAFIERIFVIRHGEWSNLNLVQGVAEDAVEFEPIVSRK